MTTTDGDLRAEVFAQIPRDQLAAATARVGELARPAADRGYYEGLLGRYSLVRRFVPALLRTIQFQDTSAGRSVLDGLRFLCELVRGLLCCATSLRNGFTADRRLRRRLGGMIGMLVVQRAAEESSGWMANATHH